MAVPPLTIDDFATGAESLSLASGRVDKTQTGASINGGYRAEAFWPSANPLQQVAHLDIGSDPGRGSSLKVSLGVNELFRLELSYGKLASPESQMNLNLTQFERLRVSFLSLNQELNFNAQPRSGGAYADQGVNLSPNPHPFTQDFLIKDFNGDWAGNENLSAIDGITFIFQSAGLYGGTDFAIQKIELM
jgi:hypothetical protein